MDPAKIRVTPLAAAPAFFRLPEDADRDQLRLDLSGADYRIAGAGDIQHFAAGHRRRTGIPDRAIVRGHQLPEPGKRSQGGHVPTRSSRPDSADW